MRTSSCHWLGMRSQCAFKGPRNPLLLGQVSSSFHIHTTTRLSSLAFYSKLQSNSRYQQPRKYTTTTSDKMASTDATLKTFFESSNFAVVGASTNPDKFGHKIFKWYVTHGLDVKPINPIAKAIKVDEVDHPTTATLSELENPTSTSLSIVTGPAVSLKALREAKELGIPSVFFQPGTYDDEVLAYAKDNFKAVLAGEGGTGPQGWCVLADGERGLKAAGKL
ncbi:CoA binding domain-containing protein [Echria macrotheca]|uniref:CoA binding domain-containing protein n=1 Tax=Echria macrotheca TaxID=438768 RepID=A0AAJ0F9N9_9PEZI|nr:CoA binding domain-containing protein [Echria macrotheca]